MKSSTKKNQRRIDKNSVEIGRVIYGAWDGKDICNDKLFYKRVEFTGDVDDDANYIQVKNIVYYYDSVEVMRIFTDTHIGFDKERKYAVRISKNTGLYNELCKKSLYKLYHKYTKRVSSLSYAEFLNWHTEQYYMCGDMIQELHNMIIKKNIKTFGSFSFLYN